jgi:hypothetical protein
VLLLARHPDYHLQYLIRDTYRLAETPEYLHGFSGSRTLSKRRVQFPSPFYEPR